VAAGEFGGGFGGLFPLGRGVLVPELASGVSLGDHLGSLGQFGGAVAGTLGCLALPVLP
jgi:hypothetical protein